MAVRVKELKISLKKKRDNYAHKLRRKKLINYLRSELRTCTTHGLPYIVNTDIHWSERYFWAVNFMISVGVVVYLISMQHSKYQNTPTVTSVEMDYFNWNVSYPAITLCPLDKIEERDLNEILNDTYEYTGGNIESHLRALCSLSMETVDIMDYTSLNTSVNVKPEDYASLTTILFKKFDKNSLTTNNNMPISVEEVMTEVGMCHVINSNVAVFHNPLKWDSKKYVKNSIDLSIYDRDFFVQVSNYSDVFKIYIHSPDEIILSTTPSYTARRKTFMHFGVQVWNTRLSNVLRSTPINIRKCRFIDEPLNERYPVYSYNHCILECRIKMVFNLCGCIPHFYKPLENERVCDLSELQCFADNNRAFNKLSYDDTFKRFPNKRLPRSPRDCGCLMSCESNVFSKDQDTFMPRLEDNVIRISISSYPKVRLVREALWNTYDLILRGGGVINLCVGASIISITELIVLSFKILFGMIWCYLKHICKRIADLSAIVNLDKMIKKR